jgi:hypothetical protein
MYGLLNAALKQFVAVKYGSETCQRVVDLVAPGTVNFNTMDPYPDSVTYDIVNHTSELTGTPADELLGSFGEFWVPYTAEQGYSHLFEIGGDSLREFLLLLDNMHLRVGRSFPKLQPPSFQFDTIDACTLRMHYRTRRPGLCPIIPGILRGLSMRFETALQVNEDVCARRGAQHCEFVVLFPQTEV